MKKLTERQRENLALAHIVDVDDCDPRNFRRYTVDGYKWLGFDHAPEWACNRDSEWWRWDGEYITVLDVGGIGMRHAPAKARGKRKVYSYRAGERSCPWCSDGTGEEEGREECDLCKGDGYLYQGEIVCHVYELTGN